jgi:hypothetical protein
MLVQSIRASVLFPLRTLSPPSSPSFDDASSGPSPSYTPSFLILSFAFFEFLYVAHQIFNCRPRLLYPSQAFVVSPLCFLFLIYVYTRARSHTHTHTHKYIYIYIYIYILKYICAYMKINIFESVVVVSLFSLV